MIDILMYANLSCSDVESIIDRVMLDDMIDSIKIELIETIKDASPECWDAND